MENLLSDNNVILDLPTRNKHHLIRINKLRQKTSESSNNNLTDHLIDSVVETDRLKLGQIKRTRDFRNQCNKGLVKLQETSSV